MLCLQYFGSVHPFYIPEFGTVAIGLFKMADEIAGLLREIEVSIELTRNDGVFFPRNSTVDRPTEFIHSTPTVRHLE
jgi:hypothetical protein